MRRALLLVLLPLAVVGGVLGGLAIRHSGSSSTATPRSFVALIERQWRSQLRAGAMSDRARRFPSPSKAVLLARLGQAQRRYGFDVVKVEILHPLQAAPLVVIRASDRQAIARATPAILRLLDPKRTTGDDRTGWAYEGFLFEAQDRNGVPFLAVFNHWRGRDAGGGQWAADETLYPFPQGMIAQHAAT